MISKEQVFKEIERERGGVADIYAAFSSMPGTIKAHFELNKALILSADVPLSRPEREWLAMETSFANGCGYSYQHHKVAYEAHLKSAVPPSSSRRALLSRLAVTLTKTPGTASELEKDFASNGFTREEWLHAVKIVSYFNFTNRLAFGLNLQLEPDFASTCK